MPFFLQICKNAEKLHNGVKKCRANVGNIAELCKKNTEEM